MKLHYFLSALHRQERVPRRRVESAHSGKQETYARTVRPRVDMDGVLTVSDKQTFQKRSLELVFLIRSLANSRDQISLYNTALLCANGKVTQTLEMANIKILQALLTLLHFTSLCFAGNATLC